MLLESLIAVGLPGAPEIHLRPPFLEGVENFLFRGHWEKRLLVPEASPAMVLATLYQAVKRLDPKGQCVLRGGAEEALELEGTEGPPEQLEAWPPSWEAGLSDGTLRFQGRTERLEYTLSGRYVTRVEVGEPPLRLALRAAYSPLFPDLSGVDGKKDPTFADDLLASFRARSAFPTLRASLLKEGRALVAELRMALEPLHPPSFDVQERIVLFDRVKGLEGLLRGFSTEAKRSLATLGSVFDQVRPEVPIVYRLETSRRLSIWRGADGSTQPTAFME